MVQPTTVVAYFDYCCPFCYLGKLELDRLEKELSITIDWRYYQIHPEYPDAGAPLKDALGSEREILAWQSVQLHVRERNKTPIKKPAKISNTLKAQLASEYARTLGRFREFQMKVYETYFLEGEGIGTKDEVLSVGMKMGLDPVELEKSFNNREFLRKITSDDTEARGLGVTGIPTIMVNGRLAMGALPYDELKYFINRWGRR